MAKYSDKILPTQEFFRHLYRDTTPLENAIYETVSAYSREFESHRFELAASPTVSFEEMSTPPFQLALLNFLVKLTGAKRILEIGTFVGHTSMQLALMAGPDSCVSTVEVFKDFADLARTNFRRNGFEDRITLIEGNAQNVLQNLPAASFDFIFIDGSKQDYLDYAIRSEALLDKQGVIFVDDVFFHGDALNSAPTTEKGRGCKRLLDHYEHNGDFTKLLLPMANGILVLLRQRSRDK